MSGEYLLLELKKQCTGSCGCKKKSGTFIATKEVKNPAKGYTKHTHRLKTNGQFELQGVKYHSLALVGPYYVKDAIEVSVYYDTDNRPYVIEINRSRGKDYYVNNKPSIKDENDDYYANYSWAQNYSLGSSSESLFDTLEQLSCEYANSVSVDIFKKIDRKKHYCNLGFNVVGTTFTDDKSIYQFKQSTQRNKPFKVHSLQYNGKDIEIPIPSDGVLEISTFYWKHHLGKPLVVKVIDRSSKPKYYFNDGRVGLQWDKRAVSMGVKLEDTVVEHNCVRNRTTTIDLSKSPADKRYCCTKTCKNPRINVKTQPSDAYKGFSIYEHASDDGLPFTISSIIKDGVKQGGIMFPIRNAYSVTVYYAEKCLSEPIFMDIKYADDEYFADNKWYRRITKNGWDYIYNIPSTDTEISEDLRNNFKIVATLLTSGCSPNSIPEDKSFTRPEPEPQESPKDTLEDLKQKSQDKTYGLEPPRGPEDDAQEEKKIEAEKQKAMSEKKPYTYPSKRTLSSLKKSLKTLSITPDELIPTVEKIVEKIQAKLQPVVSPPPPGVIIDIQKDLHNNAKSGSDTYNLEVSADQKVNLEKSEDPKGSSFFKFTHTKSGGGPFKVEKVIYGDSGPTVDVDANIDESISHLAVWYWNNDSNLGVPLLIEVFKNGHYKYHYNKGDLDWRPVSGYNNYQNKQFTGEALEQKLDDLNCYNSNAVTLDLTNSNAEKGGHTCCEHHKSHSKVKVSSKVITISSSSLVRGSKTSIPYYKYSVIKRGDTKLAKIKYYIIGDDNRKRIITEELDLPIQGPVDVYVFHCSGKPALIYMDPQGTLPQDVQGWYKRGTDDNSKWEKLRDKLTSVTSDNLDNLACGQQKELVEVLNSLPSSCKYEICSTVPGAKHVTTSSSIVSAITTPEVTVKLEHKPKDDSSDPISYPGYLSNPRVTINVKILPYLNIGSTSNSDFYKYEHKDSTGVPFKLMAVIDDQGHTINGASGERVTSVSAYYWRHEDPSETPKNVLSVEVVSNGQHSYYAKNGKEWKQYSNSDKQLDQNELVNKLIFLNCEINDVVQIDVTRIDGQYCHDGYSQDPKHDDIYTKKVKVTPVSDERKLGNYTAYSHTPNTSAGYRSSFHISTFTRGRNKIDFSGDLTLPVIDVKKVVVYFCGKEVTGSTGRNPLLLYIDSNDPKNAKQKWFKKPDNGTIWESAKGLDGKDEKSYTDIVDTLDTIKSACQSPKAIIDIYERENGRYLHYYSGYYGKTIEVTQRSGSHKKDPPEHYTRYDHQVVGREDNYFTLPKVNYENNVTDIVNVGVPMPRVTRVSVYYWTPLETPEYRDKNKPLIVKVVKYGRSTPFYYENKGENDNIQWTLWQMATVSENSLRAKLYLLNCRLNNAVVIDISKRNTENYDSCKDKTFDGCHGNNKMKVEQDIGDTGKLLNYQVYKHSLQDSSGGGKKFHIVSFKNDKTPLTGISASYTTPILDVDEVKVYFCKKNPDKPLLLYYNTSGYHNLYKNNDLASGTGGWVCAGLLSTDPDKNHEEVKRILEELGSECKPQPNPASPTDSGPEKLVDGASGLTITAILTGLGSTSGTLAGAGGLTGLGWWAFKRSRGDPWVRQI
ncbi:hypothetical protein BEWA_046870 [Theileria equi strain WA]|uniref:Uncharacterized protein n=1 Tax=Theileria equi strain WA TaxID=1537102 RepID=L1LAP3_THEEQ|nr:hypothetical protein BEWA_046870 [Theileria equi strain WA]EKX72223.1 hypothetical protein BEWA_046870 [Theileria equi strain WA]|eukprot:XP_004831675.1 hypothetical protein BEWA_046870 [Theileria equi strain WA]